MARFAVLALAMIALFRLTGYVTEPRLTDDEIHRIAGEPARLAGSPRAGALKVVTWNIEQGRRFADIVRILRALEPDVILLQEVDRACQRSGGRDVARDLAHALDMNWVTGGEFQEVGEGRGETAALTGQAILSRTPIDQAVVMVFRDQALWRWRLNPLQPRRGGRIALKARTAGTLIYNLHIESSGSDALRQSQLREILVDAGRSGAAAAIVGGDFNNTAAGRSSLLQAMAASGFVHAPGADRAQTSPHHRQPIDWIFQKGNGEATGHVERAPGISDHDPVVVTLTQARRPAGPAPSGTTDANVGVIGRTSQRWREPRRMARQQNFECRARGRR
jgi:endonuclease/exonuclease/phosphatase family metal-dependent hydrolase